MTRKNPKAPDAARPLSCVLYIRVSTKLQVEKGESIDAQRFELTGYAENHGMRVLGEYVDAGFSGKNVQGRPQFRQMMDDIIKAQPSKRPAYVLVFKLSRFGRNAADTWNSLQTLQDYGVELCCVKDGIDSGTSMGKAMLSIAAVFAEMERDNIRTQTMSGREEKARIGYWNGGQAPFGYRLVDKGNKFKELEVDEDEAKVVRRIFEMYAYENKGSMAIATWLNNHGIKKKPRGNARMDTFSSGTVQRMITNPVYIGKIAYGRRRTETIEGTRGETHVVKSDGYEIHDGQHDAIIDDATWAAAQAIVGTRKPNMKTHDDGHGNGRAGVFCGDLFCCLNYSTQRLELYKGSSLLGSYNVQIERTPNANLRTAPNLYTVEMRIRNNSVRVYSGAANTFRFKVDINDFSGGYAGIRSDNRMISDLLRLGDAWTYEPYESVDITFPNGNTVEFGRIPRTEVTWDNEFQVFKVNNDVEEISTRNDDISMDYDFFHSQELPLIAGNDYTVKIKPKDINLWISRLFLGDADGFSILYYQDVDSLVYWANEAAYRWKLRGIAIWSLGQEDMRVWEALPKQI